MKVLRLFLAFLLSLGLFACNSNEEGEQQPLSVVDYCEVALGDTTQIVVTGGSGNIVVRGNSLVEATYSSSQNDNQQRTISLVGKSLGTTNIVVQDNTTNESSNVEVHVVNPFLILKFFSVENLESLGLKGNYLFALIASEDSICYVFSYNNMQFKYNDIPVMKGSFHVSENGKELAFDLKGEKNTFKHSFRINDDKASFLLSNMSSISTLPRTSFMINLTDIDTNTEFPYICLENKVLKTLPKRE